MSLLAGFEKNLPIFSTIFLAWIKLGIRDVHVMLLSKSFMKISQWKSYLHNGVSLYSYFCLSNLLKIWYKQFVQGFSRWGLEVQCGV